MEIKDIVIDILGQDSYLKAKKYDYYDIEIENTKKINNHLVYEFSINSDILWKYYRIIMRTVNSRLYSYGCDCYNFIKNRTCEHVAAVMLNYNELFFPKPKNVFEITESLLDEYNDNNISKMGIKEALKFIIELDLEYTPSFKIHVGQKKTYVLNNETKFYNFINAYKNNKIYKLGKDFTYDSNKYYLKKEDKELLDYLNMSTNSRYYYNTFELSERELQFLFAKLNGREFKLKNYGVVNNIVNGIPTNLELNIKDNNYFLSVNDLDKYNFIDDEYKYIYYKNTLYLINNEYRNIFKTLRDNNLNELVFSKEKINTFKNGLFKKIKNNITISDDITDIVISDKPDISLYFDINKDIVNCDIKLDYKGNIINYFEEIDNIFRSEEYENELINKLLELNFSINNNKILLSDIEDIGYFLSEGINNLSDYKVYTSKKLDDINIVKNSQVRSNFSIGKDGIMTYSFDTDNININELDNVFSSLKNKKKYYKLKNGNIIDLNNNEELNELSNIFDDLNISLNNIDGNNIEIPKYRAFYIDSLKNNKYSIIDTDNSFNKFINNFKKYKNIDIKFDLNDEKILRDYQKDGVKWLYTLYKCDLGGILADEMGLGKSIQTIMFIKEILKNKNDAKIMIVCPTSLVYNWKNEFDKFAPDLKYVVVAENKEKRKEIIDNFDNYNIFITTYGLIRNDNDEYEDKYFELCVIDEAQAIKNYQANMTKEIKKIKSKTKIALTGTPLENSVLELWSIFDFIMPGYLNNIKKFKELYGIKDVDNESLEQLDRLNYQIKPFILRRKKNEVYKDLPEKIENNIYLDLPLTQKTLYLKVLKESKEEIDEMIETEGFVKARFKILQLLMKLRQICIDPNIRYNNYKGEAIKIDKLLEIVKAYISDGHKILIFSSFKTVIDRVKDIFDKENISSYMISGEVKSKDRMDLVNKFNNDDTNFFLITLKSGGTGLNLTSADIVIHLDIWWNPQVENQATDRAHRIGQKNKVTVVKLITRGTIEERIIELQNKKKILSEKLIEGKSCSEVLSSLSESDVKNLLSMGDDELL